MHPAKDPCVFLFHCDAYDPTRIRGLVRRAMEELDLRPRGRTLLKPNVVASGELFQHAYTRPELVEGASSRLASSSSTRTRGRSSSRA
jgi:hypothetical protein